MNASPAVFFVTLLLAPAAFAASSTDLTVQGTITPNGCEPALSGGGVVDYGKMAAKELNPDSSTRLPDQELQLSIQCDAPTMLVFNTIDNRRGTSALYDNMHGLGLTPDDEMIGSSGFSLYTPMADGVAARTLASDDGGATWGPASYLGPTLLTAIGAAADNSYTPLAITRFTAQLRLLTLINHGDRLTVVDEIPMDGHATLQIKYL